MPTIKNQKSKIKNNHGFTTIELVMVIVILGILSAVVAIKWPTGMKNEAAVLEFKHAVRYAQHRAMTREYTVPGEAWGIIVASDKYTVQRADADPNNPDPADFAEAEFCDRALPGNATIIPEDTAVSFVWFNGLGEPINIATGDPLDDDTAFRIGGTKVTVNAATGYVE